jgi:3'-phosphoadenosine 5'-phosphosulfate sulfotransferase (PAPS reductase)/FAD synthetase
MTTDTTPATLADFDVILLNSSGGKDSQAMLDYMARMMDAQGVNRSAAIVVHADLGRVEWEGTKQLAEAQAAAYGFRFMVVARDGDLLDQIIDRRVSLDSKGKVDAPAWPSSAARFCTSDQKTGQVVKLMTQLVRDSGISGRQVRILNCLGIRAEESPARAKKCSYGPDSASNGKREVVRYLPIFDWTATQVWDTIRASGVAYHPAYDLGMSRLSCVFCVFASKADLTIAAKANPQLAQEYVAVEILVRSTFRADLSMADVVAMAEAA